VSVYPYFPCLFCSFEGTKLCKREEERKTCMSFLSLDKKLANAYEQVEDLKSLEESLAEALKYSLETSSRGGCL
jgi:hypothetical protein